MAVIEARHAAEVNTEWLMEILRSEGYTVSPATGDPAVIVAKHTTRPNVVLKVHPELDLITVQSYWTLKKAGFGGHKDLLEKLNAATASPGGTRSTSPPRATWASARTSRSPTSCPPPTSPGT